MAATPDGTTLYVANHDGCEIAIVDVARHAVLRTIPLERNPNRIALSQDEKTLYVAVGDSEGELLAIDLASEKVVFRVRSGHTPEGLALTPDGRSIFVCNRFSGEILEFGLPDMQPKRCFQAIREPRGAVVTLDGKYLLVNNFLPNDPGNFPDNPDAIIDVAAEVTLIDLSSDETKNIRLPSGSGSLHDICISPDGRFAYLSTILARFQVPTTQIERGWMNTNGIVIIDLSQLNNEKSGFIGTVLLDDVDLGASNPYGITTSADGKEIYVTLSGTDEIMVVNAALLHEKLAKMGSREDPSSDLSFLVGMKKRIPLSGKGSRSLIAVGRDVYVGMYFSDTLQKVNLDSVSKNPHVEIPLGPKPVLTPERRGEIHWNDASLCFQKWQSCASCHPDARMDAYNWDLLNDGMGNPKNAKSLLWCNRCPPAMWEGVRESSNVCTRTGFQFILFTLPDEEKCLEIDAYVHSLDPLPSPYLVNGELSERAQRGKKLFNDRSIGCAICHPGPLFTDLKKHDVKSKTYYDQNDGRFDTPTLVETWRTAPYLHDGRYVDMKDLFKLGKHGDVLGNVDSLTDDQVDDLVEYILSL